MNSGLIHSYTMFVCTEAGACIEDTLPIISGWVFHAWRPSQSQHATSRHGSGIVCAGSFRYLEGSLYRSDNVGQGGKSTQK